MSVVSYYVGEILSKGIRGKHIKCLLYREVELRGRIPIWCVRKIVPEIVLNEELINRPTKLIYWRKPSIAYLHILSILCIVCIAYSTL